MGLELNEIILACEEEYGIRLDDESYRHRVCTAGDLLNVIMDALEKRPDKRCQRPGVFFRTRAVLADSLGVPRRSITPQTRLDELIPFAIRPGVWRKLERITGLSFPGRVSFLPCGAYVAMAVLGTTIFALVPWPVALVWYTKLVLSVCFVLLVVCPLLMLTTRYAIAEEYVVLNDALTEAIRWAHIYVPPPDQLSPENVWRRVRDIIALYGDVPEERVTREADLLKDLRLG